MKETIKYRGVKPATIVTVLEGNGKDVPLELVQYVIVFENVGGMERQITLGKVVPLTEEEKSYFTP